MNLFNAIPSSELLVFIDCIVGAFLYDSNHLSNAKVNN